MPESGANAGPIWLESAFVDLLGRDPGRYWQESALIYLIFVHPVLTKGESCQRCSF